MDDDLPPKIDLGSEATEFTSVLKDDICSTKDGLRNWQQEATILEVTEEICRCMNEASVSRLLLSVKTGHSIATIYEMLDDGAGLDVRTISDIFTALGRTVTVSSVPM